MRFIAYLLLTFFFLASGDSYSQATDSLRWHDRLSMSFGTGASIPTGPLARKYDRTPWSVSFSVGMKPNHSRFQFIFFQANYQRLAQFRNIFPVQSPQGGLFEINHSSRSNVLSLSGGYRYEFDQIWYVIPRVSFSFGACNAYVFTSLKDNFTDEVIESYREASDWSYLSTIQGGFNVPIIPGLQVSFLVSYLRSGSLDIFLPRQDPLVPSPVDPFNNFEFRRSSIDLLAMEIGVTLYFNQFP
jgi:hypothetical protein